MPVRHKDFQAWIFCEDDLQILKEFNASPDPEDERVYNCWVASESGRRFTVYWDTIGRKQHTYRGVVSVDGVETDKSVHLVSHKTCGKSRGAWTATGDIRPYAFSEVILTDDESFLDVEQSTNMDDLGNITVKIYLVKAHYKYAGKRRRRAHYRRKKEVTLYDGAIHEATKNICDHRITLGEAIPSGHSRRAKSRRRIVWDRLDPNDTAPHVVFRFMYRPRAYLQAQGIIPTPTFITATLRTPLTDVNVNRGNIVNAAVAHAGQKRKRGLEERNSSEQNIDNARVNSDVSMSLTTPLKLRGPSQTPRCENTFRRVFYETPRPIKKDEDLVFLGFSERKGNIKQDENSDSPLLKRLKLEYMTPIKHEIGMSLWMDDNGSIDLTMD